MKGRILFVGLVTAFATLSGCGRDAEPEAGEEESAVPQLPAMLRARFLTEMKMILIDIQRSEERAAVQGGSYLGLEELKRNYLSRPIPETYSVAVGDITRDGYSVEIIHIRTGLRCALVAGGGRSPVCK